jgi:hypothetical protein
MKKSGSPELFFLYPFVDDQKIKVVFEREISLFVTETILRAFLGFINAGEIIKVETFVGEFLFVHLGFFGSIQILQNAVVLSQNAVYIAHQICGVAVQFVVVCITTHIGAKLFVYPAAEFFITFEASAFFGHGFED